MNSLVEQILTPIILAFLYWASDRITKEYWNIEYHRAVSYFTLLTLSILVVIFINPYQNLIDQNKYTNMFTVVVSGLIVGEILSPVFDKIFGH